MKHIITTLLAIAFILLSHSITGYKEKIHAPPVKDTSNVQTIVKTEINRGEVRGSEFELTAYCACMKCCGKTDGITASGVKAVEGVTIAADTDVLPIGTVVEIEGIGRRVVQDTGGAIQGKRIDVYFDNHQDALNFSRQKLNVVVIEWANE